MSLRAPAALRPTRSHLRESGVVTATLLALFLWRGAVRALTRPISDAFAGLSPHAEFALVATAAGGSLVAGVALLVGAYALRSGVDAGLSLPTRADAPLLALAGVVPVSLVAVTGFVGAATGVPYGSLTMTHYGSDPETLPVVTVVGLGVAVGVPCLALVCQVLVQGGLERALGDRSAVLPTTLVAAFLVTSDTGGLTAVPDRGRLYGAVLFLALLALAVSADERASDARVRSLAVLPVVAFVALAAGSGLAGIDSLAGALFALTHLAALGVAAFAYDRSDSLLVPAFAYLCLSLSTELAVVLTAGPTPPF